MSELFYFFHLSLDILREILSFSIFSLKSILAEMVYSFTKNQKVFMKKSFLFGLSLLFGSVSIHTSNASETLFTINGKPVSDQEFSYIYQKNSINGQADFSKQSLEDYLKLFINYKLKVQQAKDLGMDTISALVHEYDGYRKQLLETHIQRQVVDPLVKQEYERSRQDVAISHVFVDKKTENAEKKINEALQKLKKGEAFSEVAKKYSEDKQSAPNGGVIGYFTALQIGFPQIEDALYNTPEGSYSDVISTDLGYHIIRVDDVRPARGRIRAAIIKINDPEQENGKLIAKNKIDSVYQFLKSGQEFSGLAAKYSEDANSAMKGGELDWFGINTYVKEFEDAAFSLKNDGDVSQPFTTGSAWYIIKRLMVSKIQPFEEAESVIKAKLLRSRMYSERLENFNHYLESISNLQINHENVEKFETKLTEVVDKYPFEFPRQDKALPLLNIQGKVYDENVVGKMIKDNYTKVIGKLGKERAAALFRSSLDELLMNVYEQKLVDSLYDYRSLLEEYQNGVLIFELTKEKVWNKATTDTVGLQKFYQGLGDKYTWNQRAEVLKIQSESPWDEKSLSKIIKKNKLNSLVEWQKYLSENPDVKIKVSSELVEKDVSENAAKIQWTPGVFTSADNQLYQVTKIIPAQRKDLSEVRGFVVAAYQEHLEKEWLENLHKAYNIKVNDNVLQKLVR